MNVFSTMQITVNGTLRDVPDGMTVRALVRHLGFTEGPVAVEINGAVVLRVDHVTRPVVAGDIVEIVHFVGGG
jgi:thiamine biosynthesis protein ThiS